MKPRVKICGLRRAQDVAAAVDGGAAYVGFNFYPPSPRSVPVAEARELALGVPPGVAKVGLTVDADDATLDAILAEVPLDILQLHGSETPDRVARVRARYGLPVMQAVGVADESDLPRIDAASEVADLILVDARPAALPGGNGTAFDWRLIAGRRWRRPWLLAGGLTPGNLAEAMRQTGAQQLDVSSGVESSRGVKDPALIAAFLRAAQA